MEVSVEVFTEIVVGHEIIQSVHFKDLNGIVSVLSRTVSSVKEKQLRDALISLGWTPPDEQKEEK